MLLAITITRAIIPAWIIFRNITAYWFEGMRIKTNLITAGARTQNSRCKSSNQCKYQQSRKKILFHNRKKFKDLKILILLSAEKKEADNQFKIDYAVKIHTVYQKCNEMYQSEWILTFSRSRFNNTLISVLQRKRQKILIVPRFLIQKNILDHH